MPFSTTWITHSELRLSNARRSCAMVAVGSCLVVAGGRGNSTVEVLDTNRNRVWNLPPFVDNRTGCSTVTVANQVAVISGWGSPTCATLPLLHKHTWCFRRLFEQQIDRWCLFREGGNIQHGESRVACVSCFWSLNYSFTNPHDSAPPGSTSCTYNL